MVNGSVVRAIQFEVSGLTYLPSALNGLVDLLQKIPLSAALGVPDGGGICGLGNQQVGTAFVNPGSPEKQSTEGLNT